MEVRNIYDLIVHILTSIGIYDTLQSALPDFLLKIIIYAAEGAMLFGIIGLILLVHSYSERKIMGDLQARLGPMVAGPKGIFQPIADGIKLVTKEET